MSEAQKSKSEGEIYVNLSKMPLQSGSVYSRNLGSVPASGISYMWATGRLLMTTQL